MKIKFFLSANGKSPVLEFINSLEKTDQAKILGCLENIQELGLESPRVQFRQIDGKLWEIKIRSIGGGYRIFYVTIKKNIMVLLHSYKKQSQKAPDKEIKVAAKRLMEVLKNENAFIG
ncbi:MAG: type II toxin-antitoxin system RelE/ParE family toxin [bacterium]